MGQRLRHSAIVMEQDIYTGDVREIPREDDTAYQETRKAEIFI